MKPIFKTPSFTLTVQDHVWTCLPVKVQTEKEKPDPLFSISDFFLQVVFQDPFIPGNSFTLRRTQWGTSLFLQ